MSDLKLECLQIAVNHAETYDEALKLDIERLLNVIAPQQAHLDGRGDVADFV